MKDRDDREWSDALTRAVAHPFFTQEVARAGFQPGWVIGTALEALIGSQIAHYRELVRAFGLVC